MYDIYLFRGRVLRHLLLVGILSALAVLAPAARADAITVTTMDDEYNADGDCSLREAIVAANSDAAVDACPAGSGADTIHLPSGVLTLALSGQREDDALTGDLDIRDDLTIVGAGKSATIIDGNDLDRVFQVDVASNGNVHIDGVAITGGIASGSGGGISVNSGSLTLTNSVVAENEDGGLFVGGLSASLNVTSSVVSDNQGNTYGGGIYVYIGSLSMANSVVDGNTAGGSGGIHVGEDGMALIYSSTISNNIAESSFSGGGVGASGPVTIVNSTISGNMSERYAGGLLVGSGATSNLYNVTIADNTADSDGDNLGDGGGVHIASGTINLQNTIIARNVDNSSLNVYPDCSGTLASQGYNLIQDLSGCTIGGSTNGNLTGIAPGLNPLDDNGGPTMTHALLPRSPAIDAGDPAGCGNEKGFPLSVDQRGYIRPVNGATAPETACDIGAVEHLSPGPPKPTASPTATGTTPSIRTPTPTGTATTSASPTPTNTATAGPSPTPTATVTAGPSPTPTNTATPGPSPTATGTATAGPSPTPTNTVTPGPSPTPTATTELPAGPQHRLYLPFFENEGAGQ